MITRGIHGEEGVGKGGRMSESKNWQPVSFWVSGIGKRLHNKTENASVGDCFMMGLDKLRI